MSELPTDKRLRIIKELREAAVLFAAGNRDPNVGCLLDAAELLETQPSATGTPVAWRTKRPERGGDWIYYEEEPRYPEGPVEPLYSAPSHAGTPQPSSERAVAHDLLTLCLRLCMEPSDSHSPDTMAVLDKWRKAWEEAAGGMDYDQALALVPAYAATLPPAQSEKEAAQSPTWDEVDAIRKGKSDIDLAQEIWRLRRQSKLLVQLLKNFRSAPSNEETINATTVHPEKGQAVTMEPRPMAGSVVAPVSSTEAPDLRDAVIALLNAIQTVATLDWLAERANKHRENRFYEGANECDSIIADLRHADGGAKTKE